MIDPRLFWLPVSEALMIGVLVGAQREHSKLSPDFGIREFVLCSAVGAACGLQNSPVLTAAALIGVIIVLMAFRVRKPAEESGFTTDLSMLAVFCLSYICALSESDNARAAVIGTSVVITFLLESKDKVRKFFTETLTSSEFSGTLLFLALVFIIYPILPEGDYGPFDGFSPRDIWTFVILVSSVSFGGYFLEKYMGASKGLKITAILGGIASTTATTLSLSKEAKHNPAKLNTYWQAATMTNAVQFPRLFAFLSAISPPISVDAAAPQLAAGAAGFLMAFLIPTGEKQKKTAEIPSTSASSPDSSSVPAFASSSASQSASSSAFESAMQQSSKMPQLEGNSLQAESETLEQTTVVPSFKLRNPLTLGPALECGLVLAIVVFINKVVVATYGAHALTWTSMLGGLVDVDAIAVSAADLFRDGKIVPDNAVGSVLLAVCMNAVFKTVIAFASGNTVFAARMAITFSVMLGVAALVLHFS